MRCLGLDLGSKTLGVATSDYTNTIATSLKTIFFEENNYPSLIDPIRQLINEYNIPVKMGIFGAKMVVKQTGLGPFTVYLDNKNK